MAWIDWDAIIAALDGGCLPASGGEMRIVRIAASLAAGHDVSLCDAIAGIDQRRLHLVTAIRHAARAGLVNISPDDAMELGQLLQFLDDWLLTDHGPASESLTRIAGCDAYGIGSLRDDLARFTFLLGASDDETSSRHAPRAKRTHHDSIRTDRTHCNSPNQIVYRLAACGRQ